MREAARFFILPRGRGAASVARALARRFRVECVATRSGIHRLLDTFDWRVHRAECAVVARPDTVVLEERCTGEMLGAVVRAGMEPPLPLRAADLDRGDVAGRLAGIIGLRALLEVARARVVEQEFEVCRDTALTARVRVQLATVPGNGRSRSVRVLTIIPTASARRARARDLGDVAEALAPVRMRRSEAGFVDRVLAAGGRRPGEYSPRPRVVFPEDASLRFAAAAIFGALLDVMRRTEPGVRDDVDPEFLHDYRVALRRTRTGLSQLRDALAPEVAREFRARFERVAAATGRLRDLDVQLSRRAEYAKMAPASLHGGFDPVFGVVQAERSDARKELVAVLEHPSHPRLMRDWKRAVASLARGRSTRPAAEVGAAEAARRLIRRRHARLHRMAATVTSGDDGALHRTRIECKKLRYLLEFFAPVLGPGSADAIAALVRVQDALGEYNDVSVQIRRLSGIVRSESGEVVESPLVAAAVGALIAALDTRRTRLRRRCERRLRTLGEKKARRAFRRLLTAA